MTRSQWFAAVRSSTPRPSSHCTMRNRCSTATASRSRASNENLSKTAAIGGQRFEGLLNIVEIVTRGNQRAHIKLAARDETHRALKIDIVRPIARKKID